MASTGESRILVVNDEPDHLHLMDRLLKGAGYHVLTAGDGCEAFNLARRERPHLIVSDVAMPCMDGIELCRRIRADESLRHTPILLVSAHRRDTASAIEGLRAGADEYLEAPYEPMRFVTQAARLVERAHSEETLRRSEEHYRILFESNPQPMWVFDEETLQFLAVNEAAVHHYGYTREEFLSMMIKDIRPPEYARALVEDIEKRSRGIDAVGLWKHLKKDGTMIDVEITSHEITFDRRPAKLALAYDVTARKEAEEALRKTEEQLRQSQKLEAVGKLAGGIAHDFNNLLTAIIGYNDLALRKLQPDDALRRNLEEIGRASESAANLTRQLLAFSRKQMLQPKVLDLNSIVFDMDRMLRRLIGEDIDLVTLLEPRLGQVKADPGQIEQVIMNLAVNARDAMPKGGKLTIETKNVYLDRAYASTHPSVQPGKYVMLAVSDSGTGMDVETQARIFEPFFTTKEVGRGTGLGLSMIYGIVKQSGGNIWVYSEPGHGTTFKIYLPRIEEEASTESTLVTAGTARGTETILVVEDEAGLRELIKEILEEEGYTVLATHDGHEALSICEQHDESIDLLITDVVMPGLSGRELAERLADNRPQVKVLFMSGYTDDAVVRHGVLEAEALFLQKPFTPDALARKVREVLDKP